MTKVAFLGLGVMGRPMAGHLAAQGFAPTVYNRSEAKTEAWAGVHNGDTATSPADAVRDADFVFACLGDDPDVAAVVENAAASLKKGAVFVDHRLGLRVSSYTRPSMGSVISAAAPCMV